MPSTAIVDFIDLTIGVIQEIQKSQRAALASAANLVANCIASDGMMFTIGTGHSYFLAAEPFCRAGGLAPVQQVVSGTLGMVDGSARSSAVEKLCGFAEAVLSEYDIRKGDVLLVVSNSGRNAVPIESALYARQQGASVIAVTNVAHSMSEPSRHPSGQRLLDVADIVLDNCGVHGDAALALDGLNLKVGPTSTIAGAVLINALMAQVTANLIAMGRTPPVLQSANVDDPDRAVKDRRHLVSRPIKHR